MIQLDPALTDFWGPIIFSVIGGPLLFPTKKIKEIYLTGLWISINYRRNSVGGGFVRAGFIFDQLPNRVCWIFHPNCLFSRWFLHFTVIIQDRLDFNTCPTRTDIDFLGRDPIGANDLCINIRKNFTSPFFVHHDTKLESSMDTRKE